MSFYKKVENTSDLNDQVPVLESYLPNSIIYITLYCLAVPPNILLAYMGLKKGLISARVKYPTLGMTIANLYGLFGFLMLNSVYLIMLFGNIKLSLFLCSFLRTVIYNTTYVIYFLFPVLAIDQWLLVCHNCDLSIKTLTVIILTCFIIPMLIAIYDLCLQDVLLYDYIFAYIRMSPYTNVFVFFVLSPSFFIFSFICNLLVLSSIVRRQSKAARKQSGRSLNPRHLQQQKAIVYTYILQAFMPLVLATPYYIANVFLMCSVDINMIWFTVGEAIIGIHPLSNALINLILLRPYRRALRKMWMKNESKNVQYDSITIANTHFMDGDCFL
ncbi:putative integral membrane protein [Brugia pahangi]